MAPRRKRTPGPASDPIEVYRRIRKPMPPPERIIPDKRREVQEREVEREAAREAEGES
jgi:hypothetical protein